MHLNCNSRHRHGSAVVVMLVILAILGIFVVANAKRLHQLTQELKIIERRQMERFHAVPTITLTITPTNAPASHEPH